MELTGQTCCFSGHRAIPPERYGEIARRTEGAVRELIGRGVFYFGSGGALGFDLLAAEVVLKLRGEFPAVRLIMVLPCPEQTRGWSRESVERYRGVIGAADKVVYTSPAYTAGCMHKRNRHLVDRSAWCICYLTGTRGGTAYTVGYAQKHGLTVINVALPEGGEE